MSQSLYEHSAQVKQTIPVFRQGTVSPTELHLFFLEANRE